MKKIVIKVNINCQLCQRQVLKCVTKLEGISQVSVEGEKSLLTVIGDVDPVKIMKQIRKIGKCAEIVSVGPHKPQEPTKPPPTPTSKPTPTNYCSYPPCCNDCQLVAVSYAPDGGCSVL